ncbi:MAG TPA: amidase, partial [Thermoanaerobaculia bacterium]|nr:amidase [Thermoanaerobaculia bacterium]
MSPLTRRQLVAASVASGIAAAAPSRAAGAAPVPSGDRPFDLAEATIADLQEGMRSGKWSARALAEKYLARIDAVDAAGPSLRSVLER